MKEENITINKDFTNFPAKAYLEEYFSKNGPENRALLSFLHNAYKTVPHCNSLIEIGGGPTIYQLISASEKVDFIIFSDFAQSCREEVRKFLQKDKNTFNWNPFIKYVLQLEDKNPSESLIADYKERIRSKIKVIIPCDIRNKDPLFPIWCPQFDILSMHSVPDAISETEQEFIQNTKNPLVLLKQGGYFFSMFVKNAKNWKCGDKWYPSFPVDEQYIKNLFPQLGLSLKNISTVDAEFEQGYDGLISAFAIKRK